MNAKTKSMTMADSRRGSAQRGELGKPSKALQKLFYA